MITQVRPSEFAGWQQAQSTTPLVLDVREPWEVNAASVRPDGFELVTMPMHLVPVRLAELPQDRPIAVLCHHGGRSMQVANFLLRQGFGDVANIAGGIDAWSLEKDPGVPRY